MAANIVNNTPTKRSEQESLQLIAGGNACRLVRGGETFAQRGIQAIVMNEDSTITSLLADDTPQTEVAANTDPTDYNLAGATLSTGSYIIPHNYELGRSFASVTCGSGSMWVYYSEIPNNN